MTTKTQGTRTEVPGARRAALLVVEVLPAFLVALLILPFIIQYGTDNPWHPSTIDLQVYVYAVRDMLAGRDIYATTTPFWNLYFIYPPIAAILMVPLAFGPYAFWQVVWTLGLVGAQQSVLRRCGVARGWKLALVGIVVVCAVEPIRTTLGYGQVNTMLMAMVVADLLPVAQGERRILPRGTLIGLAAAIKLTPALFVVFALLLGKKKLAITGMASFVVCTAIGAILQWHQTYVFWFGLSGGDTRTASPLYVGNQSLLGVFYRLIGSGAGVVLPGIAFAGIVALLATLVAAHWWRSGHHVFAVSLVGLATCLASPLSWTHHYVWIAPMGAAVLIELRRPGRERLPRWALVVAGGWVIWVSVCLPLAILPYGGGLERAYGPLQELVANLGPSLGVILVVGLAVRLVQTRLSHTRRVRAGAPAD
ncbi:MAG: glycosyltransferase 87 family protein [Propionibacteriaceae bacterium]